MGHYVAHDDVPVAVSSYRSRTLRLSIPRPPIAAFSTPPHSHSIVLSDDNALIFQRKFFPRTMKNRLPSPSEIRAYDFKRQFRRFEICSVSATIGIDRSIFRVFTRAIGSPQSKKDRQGPALSAGVSSSLRGLCVPGSRQVHPRMDWQWVNLFG
jgi:hypothetical protein